MKLAATGEKQKQKINQQTHLRMGSVPGNKLCKVKCIILFNIDEYCLHYSLAVSYTVQLGLFKKKTKI